MQKIVIIGQNELVPLLTVIFDPQWCGMILMILERCPKTTLNGVKSICESSATEV
jgi:hypothetical protein